MGYNSWNAGITPVIISTICITIGLIGIGYYDDGSYEAHGDWTGTNNSQTQSNNLQIALQPQENRTLYNRVEQKKSGDGHTKLSRDNQR